MCSDLLAASQAKLANPATVADDLGQALEGTNIGSKTNVDLLIKQTESSRVLEIANQAPSWLFLHSRNNEPLYFTLTEK